MYSNMFFSLPKELMWDVGRSESVDLCKNQYTNEVGHFGTDRSACLPLILTLLKRACSIYQIFGRL